MVRHGETEWNATRRYQGQQDIELNDKGREQAQKIAARLAKLKFDLIYSSDLKRAKECADLIAAPLGMKVETSSALRERCFGILEGKTRKEAEVESWWAEFKESKGFVPPPGGETREKMRERVINFADEIASKNVGEMILLVTHGGVIRQIVAEIMQLPKEGKQSTRIRLDNCSLTIAQYDTDSKELLSMNDISHLFPDSVAPVIDAITEREAGTSAKKCVS